VKAKKRMKAREAAERVDRELGAIRKLLRQPLDAEIAKGELTGPQRSVMSAVVRADGIRLKELSVAVSLAASTVSGIVDRLVQKGMLERRVDAADGRSAGIYPTAVVKNFVKEELPRLERDPLVKAMERATGEEREEIERAVVRLRELLEG